MPAAACRTGVTLPSLPVTVLAIRVDVNDPNADAQVDVVALIPLDGIQDDVVRGLLAGENGRQHDAVVVDVRLVAEDGDLELRRVLQDLLEAGHPRHAVADDHEALHRGLCRDRDGTGIGTTSALDPDP